VNNKKPIQLIADLVSENDLKSLLEKTLHYINSNFTVTKCAYITVEKDDNYVTVFSKNSNIEFFIKQRLSYFHQLPVTPIQIAINERKNISLNTLDDLLFNVEELYYKKNQPKSIACFPLVYNNKILGVIYCENNKREEIFATKELSFFLELQAIIAYTFNNALLLSEKKLSIASKNKELQILERKIVDIQKEKEVALNELNKLSIIVRETDNSIMIFDSNWNLEWVNNSFLKLYGYTKGDFIETFGANLLENSNTPDIKEKIADCINNKKSATIEITNFKRTGDKIHLQRTLSPIFNNKLKLEKFVAIDIDITQLKQAQEEIKLQKEKILEQHNIAVNQRDELKEQSLQLIKAFKKNSHQAVKMQMAIEKINDQNSSLEKARIEADRANAEKSMFLANMSHEIRTPLNGILGLTSMLLKTHLNSEQQEFASLIKESADSLLGIINNILDISKIEAGKIELESVCFNLDKLMFSIVKPMQLKAKDKGIELFFEKKGSVPDYLKSDSLRLKQIIINLLNNAIKFTIKGKISLIIEAENNLENETEIKISVTDTGIGIPPQKIQQVQEAFSQADVSTTRKYGGTGLGLSISKQLIDLLGGKLQIESKEGEGSTFWFCFTSMKPTAEEVSIQKKQDDEIKNISHPQFSNFSILIAEDNPINQKYITSLLGIYKIKNKVVTNGKEAVEEVSKNNYSCILMDMHMPLMNGIEATKKIRELESNKSIPIVALTAAAYKQDEEDMLNAGMNFFISKPIDEDKLLNILALIQKGTLNRKKSDFLSNKNQDELIINKEAFDNYFKSFDKSFIDSIIDDFKISSSEKLNQISQSIINKDHNKLKQETHSLKGELSIFCANKAKNAIHELEDKSKNMNFEDIEISYQYAASCIHELIVELQNYQQ